MNKWKRLFWQLFLCPWGKHWWVYGGGIPPGPPWRMCNACGRNEIRVDGEWIQEWAARQI